MSEIRYKDDPQAYWHWRFRNHVLVVKNDPPNASPHDVRSFWMQKPGQGWMETVVLTFAARTIVLSGDMHPSPPNCRNGVVSNYNFAWFSAGKKHGAYLAEKFGFERSYDEDAARAEVNCWRDALKESTTPDEDGEIDGPSKVTFDALTELLADTDAFDNAHALHERITDNALTRDYAGDGCPGWVRPSKEVSMLAAIQHRFVELYADESQPTDVGEAPHSARAECEET